MTNAQTEARAIARKILEDYGLDADEHFVLAEIIATALAAKDAELAKVRAAHQTYVGKLTIAESALAAKDANIKMLGEQMVTERLHGYELLERAERAEAQLAEVNKALDEIAKPGVGASSDWSLEECERYWFSQARDQREIARRAREAQGGNDA